MKHSKIIEITNGFLSLDALDLNSPNVARLEKRRLNRMKTTFDVFSTTPFRFELLVFLVCFCKKNSMERKNRS